MRRTELVTDPAGSGELPTLSEDVLLLQGEHQSLRWFCREACAAPRYGAESQEPVSRAGLGLPQDGCVAQSPPVHAAHVLTQATGHILALQAILPIEQLLQVISRLHFGFKSCHHPLGHMAFPKRERRTEKTHCMPQAAYLETSSAGLRLPTWTPGTCGCQGPVEWGMAVGLPGRVPTPGCAHVLHRKAGSGLGPTGWDAEDRLPPWPGGTS